MTHFDIGELYTRDQVRAALGLPPMAGGDWATGYARVGEEVFVFCNVGIAGRTGHDYPNRWIDDALDWFGKTGSTMDQPLISAMLAEAVTTHVFWRAKDRGPFIYAGVGIPDGAWGGEPVEVLWRFDEAAQPVLIATDSRRVIRTAPQATTFRHGPPPSFGLRQMLTTEGACDLYLMALEGAVDALFPHYSPAATSRSIVKVGISRDPQRRQRELNVGFPRGAAASWRLRTFRTFGSAGEAYSAEGKLLERLAASGRWISGEFAIVPVGDLDRLLA
ncbi:GIY-YIG nuclease family protein [Caulobacter sp. 602-1]|uniref:GIY-YIG nuclease family protein n=1 Tax=Caulobacter sp. 602-1 TaxID=2492472 RepID=UPI000F635404|nr:GIY-YIG nuclease family protein [Caulobacter sp. 602-1]RRN63453.1 GIY-YIG nuclease family protein [Caulobacter sp. 602-1]